jgi:hypothetical protein
MPTLQVPDRTYRELELLAACWHTTIAQTIDHLVIKLAARATVAVVPERIAVPVHAFYDGHRTEAVFDHETHEMTITSGPLQGAAFESPVTAEDALCTELHFDPGTRAGWTSWVITASNIPLDLLAGYRLNALATPAPTQGPTHE